MHKKITDLRDKIAEAWAVYTAVKSGILDKIGNGVPAEALANTLHVEHESLASLLRALAATGYLEQDNGSYRLSELSSAYLTRGGERDISDIVNIFKVYDRLQYFGERLHGRVMEPNWEIWDSITEATSRIAQPAADTLLRAYPHLKNDEVAILDVGCGNGAYLNILAGQNENAQLTGIEKYGKMVTKADANNSCRERSTIIQADFLSSAMQDFDAVMFNNLFHILGQDISSKMLQKAYAVLKKPGLVCVLEPYLDGASDPAFHAFFDMNMRLSHKEGKCFRKDELCNMIAAAGFEGPTLLTLDVDTPQVAYFIGQK